MRWVYLDLGKFGGLAETMDEFDPLPDPHPAGRRRDGTLRPGRSDMRQRRRALREGALRPPGQPGDRRQGADRGYRGVHVDLCLRRLQRLLAVEDHPHLSNCAAWQPPPFAGEASARDLPNSGTRKAGRVP